MVSLLAVLTILTFPLSIGAQIIEVWPTTNNFGSIEQGTSVTAVITVQNTGDHNLIVKDIYIQSGNPEFQTSQLPTLPANIAPPDGGPIYSIWVEVTFTPSSVGAFSGTLAVDSNDSASPTVTVSLQGTGVYTEPPPSTSVAVILAFFDTSVADGTLYGDGPGNSANGRRNALRNKIVAAGDLIDDGSFFEACEQLMNAYERCDGLPRPPEFVAGPAAPTLAGMISDLMAGLGCE